MAARFSNGITGAYYGTTAAPSTAINNLISDESKIEFEDEEGNPVDPYGNQYAGVLYALITLRALDLAAFTAIRTNYKAGTKQYFKFDLVPTTGTATATTAIGVNLQSLKPLTIEGRVQGRSDGFEMKFRVPYDSLTFA